MSLHCSLCFSLVTASGGYSLVVVCRLLVALASLVELASLVVDTRALWCVGSVVVVCGLSCFEQCGILVPGLGIELASPALGGRFLTIGPQGKSLNIT